MDTNLIKKCADRIKRNQKALQWLLDYGGELSPIEPGLYDAPRTFSVQFNIEFAQSKDGAQEASDTLDAIARLEIERLVTLAIEDCRNTIEIDRAAIRREAE